MIADYDPPFESPAFVSAFEEWLAHRREKRDPVRPGSKAWAKQRAQLLGVTSGTDYGRRTWTADEDDMLARLAGEIPVTQIAKRLGRSPGSITNRMKRVSLYRREHCEWYSQSEVAEILGVDSHWVKRRMDAGTLKATPFFANIPRGVGLAPWRIERRDLRKFLRRYPDELRGRNVDLLQIVDILVGLKATGG